MRTRAFFMVVSLFDSFSMPRLAAGGCDKNHGMLVSDEAFYVCPGPPRFCPLGRIAASFAKRRSCCAGRRHPGKPPTRFRTRNMNFDVVEGMRLSSKSHDLREVV